MFNIVFFLGIILSGMLFLFLAFKSKKTLNRNREFLIGERPKEKEKQETKKGKNKQQIELELLLVNNNPLLKLIGLIDRNIKIKLLISILVFGFYYLFNRNAPSSDLFLGLGVIFIVIIIIPGILTNMIIKRKVKNIMVDLPGFVDLVAVCVQTGMTINMALQQVATDFKTLNPDLSYVMMRVIRKAEIIGIQPALDDLAISLPTREIRMFTTVLQQSLNFGSSIYGHLIQLSADIRELQLLTIEERLGTLAAKMSIPLIVFIMFPIVILIVAPGAMRVFPNVF